MSAGKSYGKPTPVRLPNRTDAKLEEAAKKLGTTKQEALRLALGIGLEHMRINKFNLNAPIVSASSLQVALEALMDFLREAENACGENGRRSRGNRSSALRLVTGEKSSAE